MTQPQTATSSLSTGSPRRPASQQRHAKLLVVDDEDLIRWSLRERLEGLGHVVYEAATGREAIEHIDRNIDLTVLDCRLPDTDGFEVLKRIRKTAPQTLVIMWTAHADVDHAVSAMRLGAYHYADKAFDIDSLINTVEDALAQLSTPAAANDGVITDSPATLADPLPGVIGLSGPMQRIKTLAGRIAKSPASTVLITGESGTGKDVLAHSIHELSERASGPFLNITCSALPEALLESELFGHERGAFTDAKTRKIGLLEQANGGTVFLDEIGEMTPPLQSKLLRFLEEKAFRRVGGAHDIHTDVRVIAATNVDLRDAVKRNAFREDLYYRLAVLTLHLPPLREREGDVERLVTYFVEKLSRALDTDVRGVTPEALRLLKAHPWPGNVRELKNAIERAILLAEARTLGARDFAELADVAPEPKVFDLPAGGLNFRELEKHLVEQALERTNGNQTRAAKLLGLNRDQIRYRIEKFGLPRGAIRQ